MSKKNEQVPKRREKMKDNKKTNQKGGKDNKTLSQKVKIGE
jgi:hypothetical protein